LEAYNQLVLELNLQDLEHKQRDLASSSRPSKLDLSLVNKLTHNHPNNLETL
jgi:hypothetical protein